ncbi:hypothetical protein ACFVT2_39625 [Streptomyces sp. NPDC058000]|uniref:hypothetical protein n=1 Tax=Streptomyces sp. NPDC058000 TaxID=3346299 RepID=UPI0036EE8529
MPRHPRPSAAGTTRGPEEPLNSDAVPLVRPYVVAYEERQRHRDRAALTRLMGLTAAGR